MPSKVEDQGISPVLRMWIKSMPWTGIAEAKLGSNNLFVKSALRFINSWTVSRGLNINRVKTETELDRNATVDRVEIPFCYRAKYLGIVLDSELSWAPNLDSTARTNNSSNFGSLVHVCCGDASK